MKKSLIVVSIIFLAFGVLAGSFILADDVAVGTGNSAGLGNSVIASAAGGSSDNGQQIAAQQREDSGRRSGIIVPRVRGRRREHVERDYESHGEQIHLSREVEVENGKTTVQITKEITYANGTQVHVNIQIQTKNMNGTIMRSLNMERDGEDFNVSVEKDLEIEDIGNHSQLVANLSNGEAVNISVLPDRALEVVLKRLKIRNREKNGSLQNISIQLKERMHNNIPKVVYNVETNQRGRFLGIFKIALKTNTEVDSENGQVVSVNHPWWAFLVLVSQSQTATNETSNVTVNETLNTTVNSTNSS